MDQLHFLSSIIKYHRLKVNEHGIHSPFVFDLYNNVVKNKPDYYAYKEVELLREQILSDNRIIEVADLGAGSKAGLKKMRKVSAIAEVSAKNKKYGQFLFRLSNYLQPSFILELGTSLGLSAAYLALANTQSPLTTIEGCPETLKIAKENFRKLELKNIKTINGNFDDALPKVLAEAETVDLVFIDGNHRKEATLNYFNQCLEKINNNSAFVFDDIYWSKGMTEAWEIIKAHPKVTVSLDLFQLGIVFFRAEQAKQHFVLKF